MRCRNIFKSWKWLNYKYRKTGDISYIIEYYKNRGVKIGNDCKIYSNILTPEPYLISIGDNVTIATGVKFVTHDNCICKILPQFNCFFGKIEIGNNCFIGAYALILPGVSIGEGSIVAAGSVVTKSVPPHSVVGGNPARIISSIEKIKIAGYQHALFTDDLSYLKKKELLCSSSRLIKK